MAKSYDGDIELSVALTPKDVQKTAGTLKKKIESIFDSSKAMNLDSKMQNILSTMSKLSAQSEKLSQSMRDLAEQEIPTQEYSDLEKEIDTLSKKHQQLIEKKVKFMNTGAEGKNATKTLEKMTYDIDDVGRKLSDARERMQNLVDTGKAFKLGADTQGYADLSNKLNDVNNKLVVYKTKWEEATGTTKKSGGVIKNTLDKIKTSMKGFSKSSDKATLSMGKLFKKILMYGFGIRSLFVLINKLRNAVKEGLSNMAQWQDGNNEVNKSISTLLSSLNYLKNSIGAAFAPILSVVAPILSKFIDMLADAINKIGMFFAALTGKNTFIKAKKVQTDYAKSLKKTGKAVDEVNDKLGEYDKLSVIGKEDKGGANDGGIGSMFEEVPIESMDKWKEFFENLKAKLAELINSFKQGFLDALGDIGPRMDVIKNGIAQIQQALIDIFTDPAVLEAMNSWANSFMYMLGSLAGMVASIGLTIASNLIGGMGQYLTENKDRIKEFLIDMFDIWEDINLLLAEFFQAFADVFSVFAEENGVNMTAQLIGIFSDAFMGILELVSRIARDILQLFLQPFIDNKDAIKETLDNVLGIIGELLAIIKDLVDFVVDNVLKMYDEHIKPLVDNVTAGISEIIGTLLEGWNTYMKPVWDEIVELLKQFADEWVKPLVEEVIGLVGDIIDIVNLLWTKYLQPFINWIAKNIYPVIAPIISAISKYVIGVGEVITGVITGLVKSLRAILTFIKKVFEGDFKGAWEGLKKDFVEIWTTMFRKMKGPINSILKGVEQFVNHLISGLNKMIEAVNGLHFDLPDWVPLVGGKSLGFTIPLLKKVSIPQLAQGAVIPPNKEFLATLGDQKQGTNIETPLDTMIEAFKTALAEEGSSNHAPIVLQLDGKTVAKVVWDETDKKYKQTGKYVPSYA